MEARPIIFRIALASSATVAQPSHVASSSSNQDLIPPPQANPFPTIGRLGAHSSPSQSKPVLLSSPRT